MKLIVLSPESDIPDEVNLVAEMLAQGLEFYHVRKPAWTHERLRGWLTNFSATERTHFVVHGAEELVQTCGLGGAHWRDDASAPLCPESTYKRRSRSCHHLDQVKAGAGHYDAVLLSPVFPSYSKVGYGTARTWSDDELQSVLRGRSALERRTEVIALGGIDLRRIETAGQLGFDGVAVLGAIWQSSTPLRAFSEMQNEVRRRSACPANASAIMSFPV